MIFFFKKIIIESIPKKLIFVLANPFGGKKQAMNIINNQVKPIFDSADIEMELKSIFSVFLKNTIKFFYFFILFLEK